MYLGRIGKILKIGPTRTTNLDLKKFLSVLSSSNNLNITNKNVLCRQTYATTRDNRWSSKGVHFLKSRFYSTEEVVDSNTFERVCEETLYSLAEYFEDLIATDPTLEKGDVAYGSGVLTIDLGNYGTYVINRQSPNKQIWLSSPTSGPKRFDYSVKEDCWIYKHDGQNLHSLLKEEFESIIGKQLGITSCSHSSGSLDS